MMEVSDAMRAEIEQRITSPDSPVGIDAKETHIIIINKLIAIEKRLSAIEARLES
jgi:hypothetical protein